MDAVANTRINLASNDNTPNEETENHNLFCTGRTMNRPRSQPYCRHAGKIYPALQAKVHSSISVRLGLEQIVSQLLCKATARHCKASCKTLFVE